MYQFDQESAENGSGNTGTFINEGLHEVVISQAYETEASTGAKGVHIDFKNKQGLTRSLVFYVYNKDGQKIFGMDQLQAIMAVTNIPAINTQKALVTYYDYEERKELQKEAMVLMELVNKPMGIIIHKEANDYEGKVSARYSMTAPLVANTNQTAIEALNQKEAKSYKALLESALLRSEKAEAKIQASSAQPASPTAGPDYGAPTNEEPFDDFPF